MSRPLVITDCDEVLLHMIVHYRDWLDEAHAIDFDLSGPEFMKATRYRESGELVPTKEIWNLLSAFFDTEMDRQTPIAGAIAAINALGQEADVVVLTNLDHHRREMRAAQLKRQGLDIPVYTNTGPKGPALKDIVDRHSPSRVFFIDDLAHHHQSTAELVPHVTRVQLVGEPLVAPHVPCGFKAGHAHARIDSWAEALPWLRERLHGDAPFPGELT
jgi:hypothetical protein